MSAIKKPVKILILIVCAYIFIGFAYSIISLILYNLRNWEIFGGFSFPPLYVLGFVFDLFLWPVYIRADYINKVGIFASNLLIL
jgi:hypothetical protein